MTDKVTGANSAAPAAGPLALRSNDLLGLAAERDVVLAQLDDRTNQTWNSKRKRWAALVRAQDAEIQSLRAALQEATDELVAFMNLPTENDLLWIEQEKDDLALIDKLRALTGQRPWLESVLGPNARGNARP